jgi:hypothetical protein
MKAFRGQRLAQLEQCLKIVCRLYHQGAGAALAAAQLRSGRDLRRLEPGFPDDSTPEEQELVGDLEVQMAAAVII